MAAAAGRVLVSVSDRSGAGLTEKLTDKPRFQGGGYPGKRRFKAEAQRGSLAAWNAEARRGGEGQEVGDEVGE